MIVGEVSSEAHHRISNHGVIVKDPYFPTPKLQSYVWIPDLGGDYGSFKSKITSLQCTPYFWIIDRTDDTQTSD
jgi:hypothetical protein